MSIESVDMQVIAINAATAARTTRAGAPAGGDGARFRAALPGSAAEAEGAGGGTGVSSSNLLALQQVEKQEDPDAEAREQGARLLDLLARLQRGLLAGHVDRATLTEIERLAGAAMASAADPELAAVVSAIRLRANLELARAEVALQS